MIVLLTALSLSAGGRARAEDPPPPPSPPATPSGLTVSDPGSGGALNLSWDANPGPGVTYTLYRSTQVDGSYSVIASGLTGITYRNTGLVNGLVYYHKISATTADGTSNLSGPVYGVPTDQTPPAAPAAPTVTDPGVGRKLEITWAPSGSGDLAGYYVYRDTDPAGSFAIRLGSLTQTSFTDTGLTDGVAYYYRVTAFDVYGNESGYTATVSGVPTDITPPATPADLTITDPETGTELKLTWSPVSDSDFAGYNIYRDAAPDGSFTTRINTDRLGLPEYTDTNLTRNQTYYYKIEAVDATGNRSALSAAAAGTPVDRTPPDPPESLRLTDRYTGKDVDLSWIANTKDEDLAGYNIYRATAEPGPYARMNADLLDPRSVSYWDKNTPRFQTLWYYITSVDQTGNESLQANVVSITPVDRTPPMAPFMLGVGDPGTGLSLTVSWEANTEDDIAGYMRYRSDTQFGSYYQYGVPVPGTSYSDNGVTVRKPAWYRVSARDTSGNESGWSQPAVGVPTDRIPPTPPATVTVTDPGTSGTLQVNWSASPESDIAGYNVWYSNASGGPYLKANTSLIAATTYQQYGLADGVPVYYRVSAVDIYANESAQTPGAGAVGTPTDQVSPSVILTSPPNNEPQFGTGRNITVTFDRPMSAASITTGIITITPSGGAPVSPTSASYSTGSRTATFTFPALIQKKQYSATISGAQNAFGVAMSSPYTWTFTTGSSAYTAPHGNFTSTSNACATCHTTHSSPGPRLTVQPNETATCFFCHDGTQAESNVAYTFSTGAGNVAFHPVKDTPAVAQGLIRCSDCHNPHGNKKPDQTLYPKLLSATDGTTVSHEGNAFCLSCHGTVNRNFDATYYADTAGDHTNANAAHYSLSYPALVPPSGTKVTCVQCHEKHAAPVQRLVKGVEESACFACHNTSANSMSGRNIQGEFAQASTHDITSATGAKVECSSCHGPHTVARSNLTAGGATSQVSNPANTKQDFTQAASSTTGHVRMTEFCIACHKGTTPPQAVTNTTTEVPYSIVFQNRTVTTNAGGGGSDPAQRGWDKSTYKNSTHYNKGMSCNDCHNSHGSPYPLLVSRAEDTDTTGTQGVCGKCHSGSPPAKFSTAKNVWPDLTRMGTPSNDRYRHPTLYVSNKHSDTEDYSTVNQTANGRHAECLDCHDPHNEQPGTAAPPTPPGPLKNVSGVAVGYGSVNWSTWNPGAGSPSMTLVNPIQNQYELCFKCHTYYSFGNNPPTPGGSITETDVSREFNPNNPSYHAVAGESKIGTFTYNSKTYRYGKFTTPTSDPATKDSQGNPWTATSRMYCEDCHRSGATDLRGPHGSNNWYILRDLWVRNTGEEGKGGTGGSNTADHLCFNCHDYNFYAAGQDAGSLTVRSAFSNAAEGKYNLHKKHDKRGCTSCHVTVVHGWKQRSLLANKNAATGGDSSAPPPYYDGSWLKINTWTTPGNWKQSDCDHSGCG